MKKAIVYILIFFTFCFIIGSFSKFLDKSIYKVYTPKTINEIQQRLNNNEKLFLNGQMIEAFIISSDNATIIYDGEASRAIDVINVVTSAKKDYRVENIEGTLNITYASNVKENSLSSVKIMDEILLFKNIILNLVCIIAGIFLYTRYKKSARKVLPNF